jgi:predicted dehydrogenase
MSELRVGVVGAGGIARARQIPLFQKHPKTQVLAVADISQEAVDRARTELDVPMGYTDYREMLEREKLDAVVVCTPNSSHAPVSIAAMRAGAHVLCEKPMAMNAAECRDMVNVSKETGKILQIAYRYRFQAPSQAAKRVIDAGELGEIYMIRVNGLRRRGIPSWGVFTNKELQGGGAMVDYGVHLLDLALWLAGHPRVIEVLGVTSQRLGTRPNVNQWGDWDYQNFHVEDHAAALIRLEGNKALQLEVSWALNIPESLEKISFSGTEGGLDLDPFTINKAANGMLVNTTPSWIPNEKSVDWDLQTAEFVDAILENRQPLVKPEEALMVNEIVDAIYQSSATGAAVKLG